MPTNPISRDYNARSSFNKVYHQLNKQNKKNKKTYYYITMQSNWVVPQREQHPLSSEMG